MQKKSGYAIKTRTKGHQLVSRVKVSSDFVINTKQSDLLAKECPYGFFKLNGVKRNRLEFLAPNGISLDKKMESAISAHDFFFIVEQIVDVIRRIQKVGLSVNNLVLNPKHIYINETTRELSFMYLPLATPHEGVDIINFLEEMVHASRPEGPSSNYLSEFCYYLRHIKEFNADLIEKYIEKIDDSIVSIIRKGQRQARGEPDPSQETACCTSDDDSTDLMPDDDKTDIMDCGASLPQNGHSPQLLTEGRPGLDDDATSIMDDDATELFADDDELTNLLEDKPKTTTSVYPFLVRMVTEEIIRINKTVFRIGKESSCVDYVISDNAAISRSHADIICRGGQFFVFDLRSKNKTYINNRVLPAEQEVEIFKGDILKLANEEFLFQA